MVRDGGAKGMNSFYIEGAAAPGARAQLLPEEAKHAFQVLRLRPGEAVCAVDPSGARYAAVVEEISKSACGVLLKEALPDNESPLRLTLYQGLPKADKMDLIVQKLTELGAKRIVPLKMERCVVRLDAKDGEKRRERLEKIAREAAKQCRRACAPEVTAPQSWKQAAEAMAAHDLLLVPWEDASGFGMKDARALRPDARDVGVVIGPEGGMGAEEVAALQKLGARTVTLGPRILRTETAAVAACALAMLLWGDLG